MYRLVTAKNWNAKISSHNREVCKQITVTAVNEYAREVE
jgi:hypothetical protein